MRNGHALKLIEDQLKDLVISLEEICYHGEVRSKMLPQDRVHNQNIVMAHFVVK